MNSSVISVFFDFFYHGWPENDEGNLKYILSKQYLFRLPTFVKNTAVETKTNTYRKANQPLPVGYPKRREPGGKKYREFYLCQVAGGFHNLVFSSFQWKSIPFKIPVGKMV